MTRHLLVVASLGFAGCSSSNEPATGNDPLGNAGAPAGTGGDATMSTGGSATTSTGGSATGDGGSPTTGTGGSTGMSGSPGTGGATSGSFSPPCGSTSGGVEIAKGGTCVAADTQLCYKTCGPINVGFKAERCTSGAYVEEACAFPPDGDYSCFKVPTADSAGCPTTPPQHNQPCTIDACSVPCSGTACAMCGLSAGYLDSKGSPKSGYCVCIAGSAGNKWSCASASAWPCPGGQGC